MRGAVVRSACAAAMLAAMSASAVAQSPVTIFGLLDIGLTHETGGARGAVTKVSSGMSNGSRIGFKGEEDLGGGWAALFFLESGFQLDDGTMGQGGLLFGRQSYAGLRSPAGTVTMGRQYTVHFDTVALLDPFGSGTSGDAKNLLPSTGDANTRSANSIKFASAPWRGWRGELLYAPGEVAGSSAAGRQAGGALTYVDGPFTARLGYHYRNNDSATGTASPARNTLLGAIYDAGPVKLHVAYGIDKGDNSSLPRNVGNPYGSATAPVPSTDSTDLLLGLSSARGAHTFMASYVRKDDRSRYDQDAVQVAMGHRYALSRRTDTYLVLSHISNRRGAGYTVGHASDIGVGNQVLSAGVRHTF